MIPVRKAAPGKRYKHNQYPAGLTHPHTTMKTMVEGLRTGTNSVHEGEKSRISKQTYSKSIHLITFYLLRTRSRLNKVMNFTTTTEHLSTTSDDHHHWDIIVIGDGP